MTSVSFRTAQVLMLLLTGFALAGCQSAYYGTMEAMGYHKRDILTDRVEEARDSQEDAKEQFASALEQFTAVVKTDGGELQQKYDKLSSELTRSESKAEVVRKRIASVEKVGDALFEEWKEELAQYSDAKLRSSSEMKMYDTQTRYRQLLSAMKRAESKMEPVLVAFRDQVLYLKHNLNAQAIAGLQSELASVESDTAALIREMEASIAEADAFIKSMEGE